MRSTHFLTILMASFLLVGVCVGQVREVRKISDAPESLGGILSDGDRFGASAEYLGTIDSTSPSERSFLVGADRDDSGATDAGSVHILFLDDQSGIVATTKIADGAGGLPTGTLSAGDSFGGSVSRIGDLGPSAPTRFAVCVGANGDDTGGTSRGAVYVLFLDPTGAVVQYNKIADGAGGLAPGTLADFDLFGRSVEYLGDLGPGSLTPSALLVGARRDDTGGPQRGAAYVLFIDPSGTVMGTRKIAHGSGVSLEDGDEFGKSLADLGVFDSTTGLRTIAIGADYSDDGGVDRGSVWIVSLQPDGTVAESQKISNTEGGFTGQLSDGDFFGNSLQAIGDLDGDGVGDLAVGAVADNDGGSDRGAVWIVFLNPDGTVKRFHQKIGDGSGGVPPGLLSDGDEFGRSIAVFSDSESNNPILAVGATYDDDGGIDRGALWLMALDLSCKPGVVNAGSGSIVDVLVLNGSTGIPGDRTVSANEGEHIWLTLLSPPEGGNGKFVVHANLGVPTIGSQAEVPFGAGQSCFELLLSRGGSPAAVWNNLGKSMVLGESKYFDGSALPDPARAPTVVFESWVGDTVYLPAGTTVTFQGVVVDIGSLSHKGASVTNSITLLVE